MVAGILKGEGEEGEDGVWKLLHTSSSLKECSFVEVHHHQGVGGGWGSFRLGTHEYIEKFGRNFFFQV